MAYSSLDLLLIALTSVDGLGSRKLSALLSLVDDPLDLLDISDNLLRDAVGDKCFAQLRAHRASGFVDRLLAKLDHLGIRAVCRFSPAYPSLLENTFDPPYVLYAKGPLSIPDDRLTAIVGTRRCTRYGMEVAHTLGRDLAMENITVVSGMARGIDACAHNGALAAGGKTIAVLGCGLDVCYPPEHVDLFESIAQKGLLLSEYLPGTQPLPGHFRLRNRIIAGLCPAVVIVEGAKGSGSMITVNYAADASREIFAVPGPITSPGSFNPNLLIRDGAHMVLCAADIAQEMGWAKEAAAVRASDSGIVLELSQEERLVVEPLMQEELSFDELCRITHLPTERLNSLLTMLCLRGIIKQHAGKVYSI